LTFWCLEWTRLSVDCYRMKRFSFEKKHVTESMGKSLSESVCLCVCVIPIKCYHELHGLFLILGAKGYGKYKKVGWEHVSVRIETFL
jgi:hypothetical protein